MSVMMMRGGEEKIRSIATVRARDDYIFDCFEPEAHPVGDKARVRREKIRSIATIRARDDYIFDRQ